MFVKVHQRHQYEVKTFGVQSYRMKRGEVRFYGDDDATAAGVAMLWLMAALLALAEDVLSEEDGTENRLEPRRRVLGHRTAPSWPEAYETRTPLQDAEAARSRWRRSPRDAKPPTSRRKPKRSEGGASCRVEKRRTRVRELGGLGYDSDEIVLFKYCAGSCRAARRNYDLAPGALVARAGVSATWQTARWLPAADCGCVGRPVASTVS
ncbi:LOW QUALITY PROTEIN: artemin [Phycodurus eques]|uniref:LOW QUALITY PROTEIN: artemin n=1 Tax=Phycodurus eques TaxID=693459 RepID=UPI002ACEC2FA|nr:LOW QUALITY PROTEIN: artemin [Phycodurus eques]